MLYVVKRYAHIGQDWKKSQKIRSMKLRIVTIHGGTGERGGVLVTGTQRVSVIDKGPLCKLHSGCIGVGFTI